jgi:DNA-binding FadR family transcriptional regulator
MRTASASTRYWRRFSWPRLADIIRPVVVEVVIAQQHRDVVDAITRGDPAAAERGMQEHLTYLRDLVNAVQQYKVVKDLCGTARDAGAEIVLEAVEASS